MVITILFFLFTSSIQSQTYKVSNNSICDVTVDVIVYNNVGGCVSCNTVSNQWIGAGNSFLIPLGSCANVCNIEVIITDFGGTPQSVLCDMFSGSMTLSGCTGQTIQYTTSTGIFLIN